MGAQVAAGAAGREAATGRLGVKVVLSLFIATGVVAFAILKEVAILLNRFGPAALAAKRESATRARTVATLFQPR
jgi:hypothetical protein